MKRKIYLGAWLANNGSSYNNTPYEFTSRREACRTMREIARGNTLEGSSGYWRVTTEDGAEVASGTVR